MPDPARAAAGTRGARGMRREGSHQSSARLTKMAMTKEIEISIPRETETPALRKAGRSGSIQDRTKLRRPWKTQAIRARMPL
jgi:hypothetical protein